MTAGLRQQNCKSFCIPVNQMQDMKVKSAGLIGCVTEVLFKSKIPHKEENKLPPNANIQETDPLVSLRFGT